MRIATQVQSRLRMSQRIVRAMSRFLGKSLMHHWKFSSQKSLRDASARRAAVAFAAGHGRACAVARPALAEACAHPNGRRGATGGGLRS
jgi:hypothetical protein